jgi:hypothetical protein
MQERSSADMSTVPMCRCTQLSCDTSLSWPPDSCEWRSGWSTCTTKMAGTDAYPLSAACAAERDADEANASSPSSDHAHADTDPPGAAAGGAPSGAPVRLSVQTSRMRGRRRCRGGGGECP